MWCPQLVCSHAYSCNVRNILIRPRKTDLVQSDEKEMQLELKTTYQ